MKLVILVFFHLLMTSYSEVNSRISHVAFLYQVSCFPSEGVLKTLHKIKECGIAL